MTLEKAREEVLRLLGSNFRQADGKPDAPLTAEGARAIAERAMRDQDDHAKRDAVMKNAMTQIRAAAERGKLSTVCEVAFEQITWFCAAMVEEGYNTTWDGSRLRVSW